MMYSKIRRRHKEKLTSYSEKAIDNTIVRMMLLFYITFYITWIGSLMTLTQVVILYKGEIVLPLMNVLESASMLIISIIISFYGIILFKNSLKGGFKIVQQKK